MDRYMLLEQLEQKGLGRVAADIERLLKPSLRLLPTSREADDLPVGSSKMGGLPDLPPEWTWPQCRPFAVDPSLKDEPAYQGGPLWFLLQINLAEVAALDVEHALPPQGMLYFFAALWRNGFPDRSAGESWRVLYFDGDLADLKRTPVPPLPAVLAEKISLGIKDNFQITPCSLVFTEYYALPSNLHEKISMNLEEADIFWTEFYAIHRGSDGIQGSHIHLLLGYPQAVQWPDMAGACEEDHLPGYGTTGMYTRWFAVNSRPTPAELQRYYALLDTERSRRAQWRMLLQLSTEPSIGLEWMGWGRQYYWIRTEDLAARNFNHVCLIDQQT